MSNENSQAKPQLHVSMMKMLSHCGIQFQRRYGARFGVWDQEEIVPPSVSLAVGQSVHKAVEKNLQNKIDKKTLLHPEQVKAIVADKVKEIWEGGMLLTDDEATNIQATYGEATDQAVKLAILHYEEIAPLIDPLGVEEKFVITLKDYPIDLSGTKDVRTADAIRDTKTAKRSPASDAARSMQMAMYCLSELQERQKLPNRVCLDFLVKNKTPKAVVIEEKPEMSWINPLLRRIEQFIRVIEAVKAGHQAFTPAQPDDWGCTARYCGYHTNCPFWSGRQ